MEISQKIMLYLNSEVTLNNVDFVYAFLLQQI